MLFALWIVGMQGMLDVIGKGLRTNWDHPQTGQVTVACYALACVIWIYGLFRRQNWVRWITILYAAFQVLLCPFAPATIRDSTQLAIYWVAVILGASAAVLLCLQSARSWYRNSAAQAEC